MLSPVDAAKELLISEHTLANSRAAGTAIGTPNSGGRTAGATTRSSASADLFDAGKSRPRRSLDVNEGSLCLHREEQDMARRRFQHGSLQKDGNWWRVRFWEDVSDGEGGTFRRRGNHIVGPRRGPDAINEKQARRRMAEHMREVNRLDVVPGSLMLVRDFVERRFKPEYVTTLKPGGQDHYDVVLKHVTAALGGMPLRTVKHEHVQRMCLDLLKKTYTIGKDRVREVKDKATGKRVELFEKRARQVPYSRQAALHLKNATSAVFSYAKTVHMYSGDNPAANVRLPEMIRKEKHSLTVDQMKLWLDVAPSPARQMSHLSVLTSMNAAEMRGLQWQDVNLTDEWQVWDGVAVQPKSIVIRRQWSTRRGGGAYHTVKARGRGRDLPMDTSIEKLFHGLASRDKFIGPHDPVFASSTGRPVDTHNLLNRVLKPIGIKLGMPWLGWHVFRHTHASWLRQDGASPADQMAMLGHTDIRTTMMYGQPDLERRRGVVERMGAKLFQGKISALGAGGTVQ